MDGAMPAPPFARREELEGLSAALAGDLEVLADRLASVERVLIAVVADIESIFESVEEADADEGFDTVPESSHADQHVADGSESAGEGAVLPRTAEESPEEEAARLRSAAVDWIERDNESVVGGAGPDFNDVTDVPPEGRDV